MSIAEAIKTARPSLSKSSVTTYSSVLGSLYKKVFNTGEVNLKNFDDTEKVIYFLRDKKPAARKSLLAALVVLTGNEKYREAMSKDITSYNEEIAKQVATPAQKAAEISPDEIHAIYAHLVSEASHLYTKKQQTVSDLLAIQDSVILALLGGEFIAPRRSLDYCAMKIKNLDTKTDNYIDKANLVFNQYKCAKTYSTQEVAMPKELQAILKKWIKINPSEWLLFDSRFQPLTSVKLNQRLNRIFNGRRISINALRHSYLTSKFTAYSKEQKEVAATMTAMGSSPNVLNNYVKLS
jgi:hypothetical protein